MYGGINLLGLLRSERTSLALLAGLAVVARVTLISLGLTGNPAPAVAGLDYICNPSGIVDARHLPPEGQGPCPCGDTCLHMAMAGFAFVATPPLTLYVPPRAAAVAGPQYLAQVERTPRSFHFSSRAPPFV
ncbi:hypothetical protein [Polycladidibacter hongkongensis]|uniref:hypothetical protein n=1 Tax=Polycladidibacter hongkongensis TaxID=1647556 RepID=UPI00082CF792|nr:hypothetical protein [Pseudovibrio hongkongensis]